MRTALIVCDMQHDLVLGELPVYQARTIIPKINKLIKQFRGQGLPVIYTKKWHKANNVMFDSKQFKPHCLAETPGAEFYKDLIPPLDTEKVIFKGMSPDSQGISAFGGDVRELSIDSTYVPMGDATSLEKHLLDLRIEGIVLVGLTIDFQLIQTALDALTRGFKAAIVTDASVSSRIEPGFDIQEAVNASKKGVKFLRDKKEETI